MVFRLAVFMALVQYNRSNAYEIGPARDINLTRGPVQAPQAFIDRYMGVYDAGWGALGEQRLPRAARYLIRQTLAAPFTEKMTLAKSLYYGIICANIIRA